MVAGEEEIEKATLEYLVEDADQLHDLNFHWLELEMAADEKPMKKA